MSIVSRSTDLPTLPRVLVLGSAYRATRQCPTRLATPISRKRRTSMNSGGRAITGNGIDGAATTTEGGGLGELFAPWMHEHDASGAAMATAT